MDGLATRLDDYLDVYKEGVNHLLLTATPESLQPIIVHILPQHWQE